MVATIYKGDLAEVTLGHETGIILTHGAFGGLITGVATVPGSDISTLTFSRADTTSIATTTNLATGNATIIVGSTAGLYPGMTLAEVGINDGAFGVTPTILTLDSATQITASVNHATAGAIVFSATHNPTNTAEWFVDSSSNLKYPKGLLAGSKLTVKGDGEFAEDDHTNGHLYTIVANEGSTITVTPAMKNTFSDASCDTNSNTTVGMDSTTKCTVGMGVTGAGIPLGATITSITNATTFVLSAAATATADPVTLTFYGGVSNAGDEFIIDALGTPTLDSTMGYNSSALLSDETVLTDQFIGLAASIALPETKVEVLRSPIVGVGRQVVVQQAQHLKNEGGSLETMMHSARWLYYALGNEAATTTNPTNAAAVDDGTNVQAIAMGDTYIGFMRVATDGTVTGAMPEVGDYITVADTTEVLTPMDDDPGSGNRDVFSGTQSQFHSSYRSEIRRVIAVDTTNTFRRVYVDDPFNFDLEGHSMQLLGPI